VAIIDNVKDAGGSVTGWWETTKKFLIEVRNEMKKVTWPSRKEVYATTVVVILTSIFFGVYLFILDYGLNSLFQKIFQLFGVA
jgi:preprotein translocase subunit SecE